VSFNLGTAADHVGQVVLVRDPANTHVIDGDQRTVSLPFTVNGSTITATAPPNGNVAPPGNYMLFVNEQTPKGLVPSVAAQVWVGGSPNVLPPGLTPSMSLSSMRSPTGPHAVQTLAAGNLGVRSDSAALWVSSILPLVSLVGVTLIAGYLVASLRRSRRAQGT
jgi:hypothetical protein